MKPSFILVRERAAHGDKERVHIGPSALMDAVTLCGKTDWIGECHTDRDENVRGPVNCAPCLDIVEFVLGHRKPKAAP